MSPFPLPVPALTHANLILHAAPLAETTASAVLKPSSFPTHSIVSRPVSALLLTTGSFLPTRLLPTFLSPLLTFRTTFSPLLCPPRIFLSLIVSSLPLIHTPRRRRRRRRLSLLPTNRLPLQVKSAVVVGSPTMLSSAGDEIILTKKSANWPHSSQSACLTLVCLFSFPFSFRISLSAGSSPHLDDPILSPISPVDVVPGLKKEDDVPAVSEGGVVKANKGMILRKSVEYIRSVVSSSSPPFDPRC